MLGNKYRLILVKSEDLDRFLSKKVVFIRSLHFEESLISGFGYFRLQLEGLAHLKESENLISWVNFNDQSLQDPQKESEEVWLSMIKFKPNL